MTFRALISVVSGVTFIAYRGRKSTYHPIRVDVPVEIPELSDAEAPPAGRLLCGATSEPNEAREVHYRAVSGQLMEPVKILRPFRQEKPDADYLRHALGPRVDDDLLIEDHWLSLVDNHALVDGHYISRRRLPTIADVERKFGGFKQLLDDGEERAIKRGTQAAARLALVGGFIHRVAPEPCWRVHLPYGERTSRILASQRTGSDDWAAFHPDRRADAERFADEMTRRNRRRRVVDETRDGAINIADMTLVPGNDAIHVANDASSRVWNGAVKLVSALAIEDLLLWARLRDWQKEGIAPADAAMAMSQALKLTERIRALHEKGEIGKDAESYLTEIAYPLLRVRDFELPRLGAVVEPSEADDSALAALAAGGL